MTIDAAFNSGAPTNEPNDDAPRGPAPVRPLLADAEIAHMAEEVLRWASYLPRDTVQVRVESGWVTLWGEVDWQYQKQSAVRAVAALSCVAGVLDQVAIRPKISMNAVKSDIEAGLTRHARANAQRISIEICGGDVTLAGVVPSVSERDVAWHSAWGAAGVRNVVDRMTVAQSYPLHKA